MMDFSSAYIGAIRQAMMLGLAHHPLPDGAGDTLTTLALVAARSRYGRPLPPRRENDGMRASGGIDPATLMPEAARQPLLRLVTGKDGSASDAIACAALRAIKLSGLGLHPFDFSRLEDFIARYAEDLGPAERKWLKEVRPDDKRSAGTSDDDGSVTAENLDAAGKAGKLAFLRSLRASDPARALSLIEGLLPQETAALRAELVGLLGVSLTKADAAFLESLAQDRASSVRDAAAALLARLPGSAAYEEKLERLRDRIEIKKAGLLRRRIVLELRKEPRANGVFRAFEGFHENKELFEGVRLGDLARILNLAEDEMITAGLEQAELGNLIFRAAVLENPRRDLSRYAALFKGDLSHLTLLTLTDLLPRLDATARAAVLDLTISPRGWSSLPEPIILQQVHVVLGAALPLHLATDLLRSPLWREAMEGGPDDARLSWLSAVAPLIPRPLSGDFLRDAEPEARRAALYHRFLLALPDPAI
ncbi:MAG: DUF5691 domain-containing protein [Pseudomonadota bacterium]